MVNPIMKTKGLYWSLAVVGILVVSCLMIFREQIRDETPVSNRPASRPLHAKVISRDRGGGDKASESKPREVQFVEDAASSGIVTAGDADSLTTEERQEREEERLVDAFDSLTDKWMEPAKGGVTMKDIDEFVAQFRKVPKARKDECLRRALNLVPDENVMLLAGILMDKSQDKELIETVYNDVLNRDEGVKQPILQQIFKDREHPCWADTAWILDITGELPGKK